jgi:hypothetical protein
LARLKGMPNEEPGGIDIAPWADRVQLIHAKYVGTWDLPAIGAVTAPAAVLVRPDGYVAWVGDRAQPGLADALTTWFGQPAAAYGTALEDTSSAYAALAIRFLRPGVAGSVLFSVLFSGLAAFLCAPSRRAISCAGLGLLNK